MKKKNKIIKYQYNIASYDTSTKNKKLVGDEENNKLLHFPCF